MGRLAGAGDEQRERDPAAETTSRAIRAAGERTLVRFVGDLPLPCRTPSNKAQARDACERSRWTYAYMPAASAPQDDSKPRRAAVFEACRTTSCFVEFRRRPRQRGVHESRPCVRWYLVTTADTASMEPPAARSANTTRPPKATRSTDIATRASVPRRRAGQARVEVPRAQGGVVAPEIGGASA